MRYPIGFIGLFILVGAETTVAQSDPPVVMASAVGVTEITKPESTAVRLIDNVSLSNRWVARERFTGNWGGVRTDLEAAGIEISTSYTMDGSAIARGGFRQRISARGLYDVNVTFDLQQLMGWSGATLYAGAYGEAGPNASDDVGDIQGLSNIDSDNTGEFAEFWLEQTVADGLFRVKIGKVDANSEFAAVEAAGEFLNSSAGFSPTIFTLPTYPDPSTSVSMFIQPSEWLWVGGGLFDGAANDGVLTGKRMFGTFFSSAESDDYFWIGEMDVMWPGGGRLAVGAWYHTGDFTEFTGASTVGATGQFALIEQKLAALHNDEGDLAVFAQYGHADAAISEITNHASLGLLSNGLLNGRPDDAAGVMVSFVDLSDAAGFAANETVIELLYRLQATQFFSLTPDLQYIINPSGDPAARNTLAMILRLGMTF